ncbi:hypothetical protein [Telmatospirillum sp. J64-1]|uniref:hypothetical protein n=1 Tax=Telmatospirillum sp. J64-1 TaxID=2502183 RepID=UPI00115D4266|nr:hypothetical protein [Telmatospirillum sp. J64-1]
MGSITCTIGLASLLCLFLLGVMMLFSAADDLEQADLYVPLDPLEGGSEGRLPRMTPLVIARKAGS